MTLKGILSHIGLYLALLSAFLVVEALIGIIVLSVYGIISGNPLDSNFVQSLMVTGLTIAVVASMLFTLVISLLYDIPE